MNTRTTDNETFKITYSAKEQEEIKRIRDKYDAPKETNMDKLRRLDASVEKKAGSVAVTVGLIGVLMMGCGMSLSMTDLGEIFGLYNPFSMMVGILIGIIGIAVICLAYPLYNRILKKERAKAAPEIIRLTNELLK